MKKILLIGLIAVFFIALLILNQRNQLVALSDFFDFGQDIK
ncbi:MAG: hypothetical protein Q4B48_08610 [Syntrophomonadaceae bacterium]|nr:hypothetical protein [Syntrophomonadaceae bacterium]